MFCLVLVTFDRDTLVFHAKKGYTKYKDTCMLSFRLCV